MIYGGSQEIVSVNTTGPVAGTTNPGISASTIPELNNAGFTVSTTGLYMISYSVTFESGYANRSSFGLQVREGHPLGGNSVLFGSNNVQYFRFNTYGQYSTVTTTFTVDLAAAQEFWLSTV